MLQSLKIDNFALIEHAELEFLSGFNVITGESGAGKSIILGAIAMLLGERADSGAIRTDANRAELSAEFVIPERLRSTFAALLAESDIEDGGATATLRRVITPNSSRNYINGSAVSLKTLHDASALLVDMQKCDEQLSLGNCARQLELLDRYAGLDAELTATAEAARRIDVLEAEKKRFSETLLSDAELELAEELAETVGRVNPTPGEDETLAAQHDRAGAAHEILTLAQALVDQLSEGESSLADRMADVNRELANLSRLDEKGTSELAAEGDRIAEAVRELSAAVAGYASSIELDEESFAAMEERLGALYTLKRRYGPTLEQVLERFHAAENAIADRRAAAQKMTDFDQRIAEAREVQKRVCANLTEKRRNAARRLTEDLKQPLELVGFGRCRFDVFFSACTPGARGADAIDIHFSANAGEELRPLRLVASSGERSRLFLALKTVLADADDVPSAVFDEIDVNIGGKTANKVAGMLHELGAKRQVILISHLPQVACAADRHFGVVKTETDGRTVSAAHVLQGPEIVAELGRMLGGGEAARDHAEALLRPEQGELL